MGLDLHIYLEKEFVQTKKLLITLESKMKYKFVVIFPATKIYHGRGFTVLWSFSLIDFIQGQALH